ncbi:Fur family transcriptional regulator [Pseudorhodobacter sp.]|jgi:Fur family ferric uptake transcriptional regulator|uniref:Fur family transcriptional regulator n=1 Tax=Pseudorhodobacter sp. TaxID=1934400 RepID=UPI002AFFC4E8|nr:Fur family transcriptional regulator [Pseudorhodobacter sp.]
MSTAKRATNSRAEKMAEKHVADLQDAGLRITPQRIAILRVLAEAEDHPDVAEIHQRVQGDDPKISIATAYRTVAALEQAGMIHRHTFEGASARFERVNKKHHDHIVDLDTGEIVEFHSDLIEQLQADIAAALGYELVHHRLELYCRKRPQTP